MIEKTSVACEWIHLDSVHQRNDTCEIACVIHNPSQHHMQYWTLHWRGDRGIFERICAHGIGHPDPDQYPYWRSTGQDWQGIHGCDGCCTPGENQDRDLSDREGAK